MNTLCDYGCGKEALFVMTNGKRCCETIHNKCPKIREKNTQGLTKAYATGKKTLYFTEEDRAHAKEVRKTRALNKAFTNGSSASNHFLKRLLKEEYRVPEVCKECGVAEWRGQKLTLDLDHIDGNSSNNEFENLRLLCPNCHSLTSTWRGKTINRGKCIVTDSELMECLKTSRNVRQALLKAKLAPKGANYARAYKLLKDL